MLCVKTAMLAHSRGNLISISWAKNLSPTFSRFLLKSESYAGVRQNNNGFRNNNGCSLLGVL
jgi:hypothetical protein